jgi:hypothetical protein
MTNRNLMQVTLTDRRGVETVHNLPFKWHICPACDGCATDRGRSVEADGPYGEGGNGFTSSEWAEQDDDFKAGYLAGDYDKPCPACTDHPGRAKVLDRAKIAPAILRQIDAEARDEAEHQAMVRAERRYGA